MAKDLVRTRRYVQKFYQMRTQLQAVGLRIQTLRSNQQMAEAMRGATRVCADRKTFTYAYTETSFPLCLHYLVKLHLINSLIMHSFLGDGIDESRNEPARDTAYYG